MIPSLLIGSDTLGWQSFPSARLGVRTKTMPGGDSSLDFTIPGDSAWAHRNVIVPEAEVVVAVDGETDFGGYLTCDPLRHRLGAQDNLALVATGPWGLAGRKKQWGYLAADNDTAKWFPVTSQYKAASGEIENLEDFGKFTTDTDGRLLIKAEGGRVFDDNAKSRLCYYLFDGLLTGAVIYGMAFKYRSYLPATEWEARIHTATDPWSETLNVEWSETGDVAAWTAATVDFAVPAAAVLLTLWWSDAASTTPTTPPYIRLKDVVLYGRLDGAAVDRDVTIADILADCAAAVGITTTRITGLTTEPDAFVAPYPTDIASVLAEATLLEAAPVEAFFDHTGSEFRFTANARPTVVDPTRNRLWVVGGRGGEDLSGLQRDWEATPEQVEVLYAVKGDATLPDGTVRAAQYPATVAGSFPLVEIVDMTNEPPMTPAAAAQYATTIYRSRQDSLYNGDVVLGETARTAAEQEVPTVKLRPGDRLKPPELLDVGSAGLYVQNVSYDYQSGRCTATVGEPWDPLGWRPKSAATQVLGSGARGGGTRGPQRGPRYRRRNGVA